MSDASKEKFCEWFRNNYPGPNTIIHNPDFHSGKIYNVATHEIAAERDALKAENERLRGFIGDFALNKFEVETPRDGHLPPWERGEDMTPYAMVEAWQEDAATELNKDDDKC